MGLVGKTTSNLPTYIDVWKAFEVSDCAFVVSCLDASNPKTVAAALQVLEKDEDAVTLQLVPSRAVYDDDSEDALTKESVDSLRWTLHDRARAVSLLVKLVKKAKLYLAKQAGDLLCRFNDPSAELPLLTMLHSNLDFQRVEIIVHILDEIGTQQCVGGLCRLLTETENPSIRTAIYDIFLEKEQKSRDKNQNSNFCLEERNKQELYRKLVSESGSIDEETINFFGQISIPLLVREILQTRILRRFDFRDVIAQLKTPPLSERTVQLLQKATELFADGHFEDAMLNVGKAGEGMLQAFTSYLNTFGTTGKGDKAGNWIEQSEKTLNNAKDTAGWNLSSKKRLEWYVLSLLETTWWLRNMVAHEHEDQSPIPEWMVLDKKIKRNSADLARQMLVGAVQAAKELQLLMEHMPETLTPNFQPRPNGQIGDRGQ